MKKWWLIILLLTPLGIRAQIITTVAGNGTTGYSGDSELAINAEITYPQGLAFDNNDNLLICQHDLIRKVIIPSGIITTVAGDTTSTAVGNGGPAKNALIDAPYSVCIDGIGNLYIDDYWTSTIREVYATTNVIDLYAGTTYMAGGTGDGGIATDAEISPFCICLDTLRNTLYISDEFNYKIRKVDMTTGIITTFAGSGINGYSGDGDLAGVAELSRTAGVCIDASGNLYIGDWDNARIRKVDVSNGIISTFAGNGTTGFSGDSGLATAAMISRATAMCFDVCGNFFFTDEFNQRIRRIDAVTGIITTIAGNGGAGFSGDGGSAVNAEFHNPEGICIDKYGSIYVSDYYNQRVRKISYDTTCNGRSNAYENVIGIENKVVISIYPNPTTNEINIDNIQTTTDYQLLNIVGAVMQQGTLKMGNNNISVQALPPGMYLMALADGEGKRVVNKIVKE